MSRPSAWVEIDLQALARNFAVIRAEIPAGVRLLYVVKDDAYGLGAVEAARVGLAQGADSLAVVTLAEAAELRRSGVRAPILLLGEHLPEELGVAIELDLEVSVGRWETAVALDQLGARFDRRLPVHIKVNSGMNRFGFSWRESGEWAEKLGKLRHLDWMGAYSHFAQSDESDKAFARLQGARFQASLTALRREGITPRICHHANSGGTLDLPESHLDMVRVGILAQGVYPSRVCRRLDGLTSVMRVKARLVADQQLEVGDTVGYGMRWQARRPSRIGILPLGYGDGFPRLRNEGHVLIAGKAAPLVGGVAMDAMMVDLTDIPGARVGDEALLMGREGDAEITPHDLASWKRTVSYEILLGWRHRLPRIYAGA